MSVRPARPSRSSRQPPPAQRSSARRRSPDHRETWRWETPILVTGLLLAIASGVIAYRVGGPYGEGFEHGPSPRQVFNDETGELEVGIYDLDGNLRYDTWSYWDGERLVRREHDDDEDGRVDHWWYFSAGATTEDTDDQVLERLDIDTDGDGRADQRTLYDTDGSELERFRINPEDYGHHNGETTP